MSDAGQDIQVWRAPAYLFVASAVLLAGQIVVAAWLIGGGDRLVALLVPLAFLAADAQIWLRVVRPRTTAGPDGLTIRTAWRTTHLSWTDIETCQAGYAGILITSWIRPPVLAPWPQKSNLARWAGHTTRADRVAAYLQLRAEYYREGITPAAD